MRSPHFLTSLTPSLTTALLHGSLTFVVGHLNLLLDSKSHPDNPAHLPVTLMSNGDYEGKSHCPLDLDQLRLTLGVSFVDSVIDLTGHIVCGEFVDRGGSGSIYKGRWRKEGISHSNGPGLPLPKVAVKVINIPRLEDQKEKDKRFKEIKRELELWRKIRHDRLLPLVGYALIDGDANRPAYISPWMESGNILDFLKRNPSSPVQVHRFLENIIEGLHYLHTFEPEIVHGDIKAANVLITCSMEACLCDFGLSRFAVESTLWITTAAIAKGTLRWMSPELLAEEVAVPTKASDIYAYAMTCYEIISRDRPFKSVSNDPAVISKVLDGQRPEHLTSFHPGIWNVITQCWAHNPNDRPSVGEVLTSIQRIITKNSLVEYGVEPTKKLKGANVKMLKLNYPPFGLFFITVMVLILYLASAVPLGKRDLEPFGSGFSPVWCHPLVVHNWHVREFRPVPDGVCDPEPVTLFESTSHAKLKVRVSLDLNAVDEPDFGVHLLLDHKFYGRPLTESVKSVHGVNHRIFRNDSPIVIDVPAGKHVITAEICKGNKTRSAWGFGEKVRRVGILVEACYL